MVRATFHPSNTSLEQTTFPLSDPASGHVILAQINRTGIFKCQLDFLTETDTHAQSPWFAIEA